jgi:hypothetical protein
MMFKFEQPPDELTWYHLGPLLQAEAGTLKYDRVQYPVHGVSNNAMACYWAGLLADGEGGMVLTDLGRRMLADWKASSRGQAYLAGFDDSADGDPQEPEPSSLPQLDPARADQLDLFGAAT